MNRVRMSNAPEGNHDARGRFTSGNKAGKGNPYARRAGELRSALFDAVTPEDLRAMIKALIKKGKRGEIPAVRELLNRTLGKPVEVDLIERLEHLESMLTELTAR